MIHIPRLPWDETFMLHAHLVATRATCDRGPELLLDPGRHGVGAVIVRDNRIIASGYAGSPSGAPHCNDVGHEMSDGHCVRTTHSELNALLQCALDGVSPQGGALYCTASPCYDCAKAIIRVGIARVIYGEAYESRYGLSPTVAQLFAAADINFSPLQLEIVDGRIRRVR
jgi:dCMP deaminase